MAYSMMASQKPPCHRVCHAMRESIQPPPCHTGWRREDVIDDAGACQHDEARLEACLHVRHEGALATQTKGARACARGGMC